MKGSQGTLISKGATVQKGYGVTILLVSSSTPSTFSVAAKALLEIGPSLQSHPPPSHSDLKRDYHLHLPSVPGYSPAGTW